MAKVTITDFNYKGRHYDSMSFDLDTRNKTDVEISTAFAHKLDEYEQLQEVARSGRYCR